jgi:hypothetical protein
MQNLHAVGEDVQVLPFSTQKRRKTHALPVGMSLALMILGSHGDAPIEGEGPCCDD